jgi:1,4-dihydroxy-2-naphthoate octaprenyltransferase
MIKALRAPFFTASIVPVLLGGTVVIYHNGMFKQLYFLLTLLGVVCLHAAGNLINDYFDYKSGADTLNKAPTPFSGGSRVLVDGQLKTINILFLATTFLVLGLGVAVFLALKIGPTILLLGFMGAIAGILYSAPPFKLVYRGLGEVVVGQTFGPLIVVGTYYVQTGFFSTMPVFASIPLALFIAAVFYVNDSLIMMQTNQWGRTN